ncbi:MAG: serine/threonine protein kinase [Blastocatellia bacterium]
MAVKYCPTCQMVFTSAERLCPDDRSVLSLRDPYHLVGRTLLDKYRIEALVGLGGMGAVYYAYHSGIDRRVAFKILQPNIALGDEHVVEMFEREAKLAGRLSHENIVDVKDAGHTDEGIAYIVMEWLEGRTLDEELSSQGRFGFNRAAGIVRQIAAALGEAHGKRVIHRDLKPENIMLIDSSDGRDHVKVLDFGIGKVIEGTTAGSPVSAVMGTLHYASPEQLTVGGHVDGRSDIYSLGIILYRMLGGKLPFNSPSMSELIRMQLTTEASSLSKLRPETPPGVENLVKSMLAKDPARRPLSVTAVVAQLDQALAQSEIIENEVAGLADVTLLGETTLQKGHNLAEQTTEEMARAAPARANSSGTFSTNVQSASRVKSSALYAVMIGAALVTGAYGLYHFVSDGAASDGRRESSLASDAAQPSPSPTAAEAPALSPTIMEVRAPSPNPTAARPNPTAAARPEMRADRRLKDRQTDKPAPPNRAQTDNRRLADEHYERARTLNQQRRYQDALGECNEALRLDPRHGKARELKRQINAMSRILKPR